jgi:mono/diheme cytochrome c family protein
MPTETETGGDLVAEGGRAFVAAGCVSCHTLADAAATGEIGPNLDETELPTDLVGLITNGRGAMPAFGEQLSTEQIEALAAYLTAVAGS